MPPTPRVAPRRRTGVGAFLLILTALAAIALPSQPAAADRVSANGWTTSGRTDRVDIAPGTSVTITVDVTSNTSRPALVDVEVYDAQGRLVLQRFWDRQSFAAGQRVRYRPVWSSPAGAAGGTYTVKVGVFGEGWTGLLHWNDRAATFRVTGTAPPTTAPPTTAPHDGATHDGATHDGATHDGATHDGATHDGATHDGASVRALRDAARWRCAAR